MAQEKGDNMNVKKDINIMKAQLEEGHKRKNDTALKIQERVQTCAEKLEELFAQKTRAAEALDAAEGAAAGSRISFYQEEKAKAEQQLAMLREEKPLTPEQYEKMSQDILTLSTQHAMECRKKVKDLLDEIAAVAEAARHDYLEILSFSNQLESEHKAGYIGDYKHISVASLPGNAFLELERIKIQYFRD